MSSRGGQQMDFLTEIRQRIEKKQKEAAANGDDHQTESISSSNQPSSGYNGSNISKPSVVPPSGRKFSNTSQLAAKSQNNTDSPKTIKK